MPRPHRNTMQTELDESLIDEPVTDFPQLELPDLKASTDLDWHGHGIYTLAEPLECPCCGETVQYTRGYQKRLGGDTILTCRTCLHELGILEEC